MKQHQASLTSAWPFLQSTADDALTDVGSVSRISDAATQSPDVAIEFLDTTLSTTRTSAYYAIAAASFEVLAATSFGSSAYVECFGPRKPEY
jgi:hypothetical protein